MVFAPFRVTGITPMKSRTTAVILQQAAKLNIAPDFKSSSVHLTFYTRAFILTSVEFMLCKTNGGGWEQSSLFFTMALDEHIVWLTSAISFFPVKVLKLIIRTSGFWMLEKLFISLHLSSP